MSYVAPAVVLGSMAFGVWSYHSPILTSEEPRLGALASHEAIGMYEPCITHLLRILNRS